MSLTSKTLDELDKEKEAENMRKIEAVLFISGKFLTIQELISFSDLNPIIIKEVLEKLKEKYENENSAIEIVEKGGAFHSSAEDVEREKTEMWKMDVKKDYADIVNRLATGSSEFSKSEQETLAIIAYKQPIKQSVLVKIRSNKSYDHIKKFTDLGLIKKKRVGRTYDLSLSDDFYNYFNVQGNEGFIKKINEEENGNA
jgi:segregation and condensation protein B